MEQAGITLTPHQQKAVDWLVTRLTDGEKLVALRGLAGTGKTSLLPALREALRAHNVSSVLGAPTHRAAMILRQKGLDDAETVHSAALVPYFTADYRRACAWLGEALPVREGDDTPPRPDVEDLPWLVYEAVQPDLEKGAALKRQRRYKAQRRLASVGISGKDHFAGFGAKAGQGVLIIDEASMVGGAMLQMCQEAYPQIVLVGDPGQLPPVKDTPALAGVEGVEITEIHRQAQDSPIVQLAYQAREGEAFWRNLDRSPLSVGQPVRAVDEVSARRFLTCPLLVWRNVTRTTSTQAIRQALGYTREALHPGEPLVCRSTSQDDRVIGFFNNGLYTITEVSPDDPRVVTVKDGLGDTLTIRAHLEELDGDCIDPRAIPFRFGYCLTVHTAQGGEWPRVYLSLPDLRAYAGMAQRHSRQTELAQWAYTAITRAKTTLRFLTQHTFTTPKERTTTMADKKIAPPSAPFLTEQPATHDVPLTPEEGALFGMFPDPDPTPESDDIADPPVPHTLKEALIETPQATLMANTTPSTLEHQSVPAAPATPFGEHEALLQGFCQHLLRKFDEAVRTFGRDMAKPVDEIYSFVHHQLQIQREKAQQAETLLDTLTTKAVTQGLQLRHDPYIVTMQALSPHGFPVSFTLAKQDMETLAEEAGALMHRLAQAGYKPA